MLSITQADVVEYVKNLKLSEVKALITQLEDELGVKAGAAIAFAGPAAAASAAPAAPVEEEKTEFDVVLKEFGSDKISVIKVVRALTGLGLKEAKEAVEGCPTTLKTAIPKADAEDARKQLEAVGAKVEVK